MEIWIKKVFEGAEWIKLPQFSGQCRAIVTGSLGFHTLHMGLSFLAPWAFNTDFLGGENCITRSRMICTFRQL
jgi:hypothetical protein